MSDPITPTPVGCKQEGCTCKDARVLNSRYLRFVRHMAQQRGQTVDRVVTAEPLSGILVRSDEPEVVESEEPVTAVTTVVGHAIVRMPPRCTCGCSCENVQTVTHPRTCAECLKGVHAR